MKKKSLMLLTAILPIGLLSGCSNPVSISFEEWVEFASKNYSLTTVFNKYESASLEIYQDYANYFGSGQEEDTSSISRGDFSSYVFTLSHVLTLQSSYESYLAYDSFSCSILQENGEVTFSYEVGLDYGLAIYGEEIEEYSENCSYKIGSNGQILHAKIDQEMKSEDYHYYTHLIMNLSWIEDESYTSSERADDDRLTFEEWISLARRNYSLDTVNGKYDYVDVDYLVYISMYGIGSSESRNFQANEFDSYVLTASDIEEYQEQYLQLAADYEDVSVDILNIAWVITFTFKLGLDVGKATYGDDITYYQNTMTFVIGVNGEYLYLEQDLTYTMSGITISSDVSGTFSWHEIDS